jgi:hypothetical protein
MREKNQYSDKTNSGCYQPALHFKDRHSAHIPVSGMKTSAAITINAIPPNGILASSACCHEDRLLSREDSEMFFDLVFHAGVDEQSMKDLVTFIRAL